MHDFISQFAFGGLISIGIGSPKAKHAVYKTITNLPDIPTDKDVYFGPAMRKTPGDSKDDVLGTIALWVDYDIETKPRWTYPPTYAIFSGHGWHCYWFLREPCFDTNAIEEANKILADDLGNDGGNCWNANRVLRVPGTVNLKEPNLPVPVEIRYSHQGLVYTLDDISALSNINKTTRHKVATGDTRGHRSRSERDWKILTSLVSAGLSDDLIFRIYEIQPCGDKHRESGSDLYLKHSLERIREKTPVSSKGKSEESTEGRIVEGEDGFYITQRKGARKISTFLLEPTLLLDGSSFDAEDAVVCNVSHDTFTWPDVTFSRNAFTSTSRMDTATKVAAWQWLGREDDLRKLLPHLLERLKEKGLPRVAATKTLGLHNIGGRWLFLGDKHTLSAKDLWHGFDGPLAWLPTKTEHPSLDLEDTSGFDPNTLGQLVPKLNTPTAIWPMIGWYAAAVLKPWIETQNLRFPILNVAGTRGSGKTTLIQRVFMPMWGQTKPTSYDSGTTKFVTLALMGSSNAVPIAFSEFRVDAVQRFLRFVLLAYDTGHDPRGKADQTTVDYPLNAPFTLDGEDLIDDAAARERIIVAKLHPHTIEESSEAYNTFKEMQNDMGGVPNIAGTLINRILGLEPEWVQILKDARNAIHVAFPSKLPDRVRNNHIVAYFGALLWCAITDTEPPDPVVMEDSISSVFDLKAGRSRTLCDDMVEHIVNKANGQNALFKYKIVDNVFYFQLAPAYDDWVIARRRQGRGTLEKDAMKTQLQEAPYYVSPQAQSGVWMFGVNLLQAAESGLDVPSTMNGREIRISF